MLSIVNNKNGVMVATRNTNYGNMNPLTRNSDDQPSNPTQPAFGPL